VIFAGVTGLKKVDFLIRPLAKLFAEKLGLPRELENVKTREKVRIFDVEKKIVALSRLQDIIHFLEITDMERKQEIWEKAFSEIINEIENMEEKGGKVAFVSMHFMYYRGVPFSLVNIRLLEILKPDIIITLDDDCYHRWEWIRRREVERPAATYLRLKEVLFWSLVEKTIVDMISRKLNIDSLLMAIKHPIETFYELLSSKKPIIYFSHPMTRIYEAPDDERRDMFNEINDVKRKIEEKAVILEPATIDDRAIIRAFERKDKGEVIIRKSDRWPLSTDKGPYPINLRIDEVEELLVRDKYNKTLIDHYVRLRDYSYIDKCDALIAYRPTYRGGSRGISEEVSYARIKGKACWGIIPPQDPQLEGHPLEGNITPVSMNELIKCLDELQRKSLGIYIE